MHCSQVQTKLILYSTGGISDQENRQIEEHLAHCKSCSMMLADMNAMWEAAKEEHIPYQPFFYTKLRQRMESKKNASRPWFERFGRGVLQPAFYALILIMGIYAGLQLGEGITKSSEMNEQTNYIETYANSQYINGMKLEAIEQEMLYENQSEKIGRAHV